MVLCNVLVSFLRGIQSGTRYGFRNIAGGTIFRPSSQMPAIVGRSNWGEEVDILDCIHCEVRSIVKGLRRGVLGLDLKLQIWMGVVET
jgi:hypothetical protein